MPATRHFLLLGAFFAVAPHLGWPASIAAGTASAAADRNDGVRVHIREFVIEGNTLIPTERLLAVLAPYASENQDASALTQGRDAVRGLYRDAGYEMVSVTLPPPDGVNGVVRLRVHETGIGRIVVSGNRHFSAASVRAALPALEEQKSTHFPRLARQLFLANDNPARQLTLAFSPGENGTADVQVKVADERPLKMAMSADNTGTRATGRSRATLFVTHANLWDAGHEVAASYTTSPEKPGQVHQFGLSYMVPLPSFGDRLQFSYTYSNTDIGRLADIVDVSGQGSNFGLRYHHALHRTASTRHGVDIGIDDKRYKNSIDYFDFGVNTGVNVDARPVSLGYQYAGQGPAGSAFANVGFARNWPGGSRNNDTTYDASQAGATANWSAWRGYVDLRIGSSSQWNLRSTLEAQYSNSVLILGEQFGLGGARSVRGFPERDVSGDRGWRLSHEVISPLLGAQHRLLGFVDGGRVVRVNAQPGDNTGGGLMSYGIGWRWSVGKTMYSALDWARVVNGSPDTTSGHQAVHFSTVWRFI